MSYIKYIRAINSKTNLNYRWMYGNVDYSYRNLSDEDQACFMFEQALILRYLYLVYNGALPALIRNYAHDTWIRIRDLIDRKDRYLRDPNTRTRELVSGSFSSIVTLVEHLAKGHGIDNLTEAINTLKRCMLQSFRDNKPVYPTIFDGTSQCSTFYATFLSYLNVTKRNAGFTSNTFSSTMISLPSLGLSGNHIVVGYDATFSKYAFSNKSLYNSNLLSNSFFEFLTGYSWSDKPTDWVMVLIGILSTYSLDLDNSWLFTNNPINNDYILDTPRSRTRLLDISRTTSNESRIYTFLKRAICRFNPYAETPFDEMQSLRSESLFRQLFVSLLVAIRRKYNVTFDQNGITVLSTIIGIDEQGIQKYLDNAGSSVEDFKAFKNSVFSEFSELYKENRISATIESPEKLFDTRNTAEIKENLKAIRIHDVSITGPAPLIDAKKDAEDDGDESAKSKTPGLTVDAVPEMDSTETEGGAEAGANADTNETGDTGATAEDDTAGTTSDNDPDKSSETDADKDTKDDTEKSDSLRDKVSMRPVPTPPDVSDKEGVKLELTSSETTDTVFYRMELKSYIDSVLENPPKSISPQKVQVLKKIEAYWLNILTPQCLHDLIDSVIKLPSMFKIHKGKKS